MFARQGKKRVQELRGPQHLSAWQAKEQVQELRGRLPSATPPMPPPPQSLQSNFLLSCEEVRIFVFQLWQVLEQACTRAQTIQFRACKQLL
jgi:hypothetical protein